MYLLFFQGPTWRANMAWKNVMSSTSHHALLVFSELKSPQKSNSSFSSWLGTPPLPFTLPWSRTNPAFSTTHTLFFHPRSSFSLSHCTLYLHLRLPCLSLKALSRRERNSSIMANLAPFFFGLLYFCVLFFFFFKLPTELCYLIFLRRSRCHLLLMTEDKEEFHPAWMQCILNKSCRFDEFFLDVHILFWPLWWPS